MMMVMMISKLHGIAVQLHILSLLTFSENFVKIRSERLTYVEHRQTDNRQTRRDQKHTGKNV